jgi:hypothetical protein
MSLLRSGIIHLGPGFRRDDKREKLSKQNKEKDQIIKIKEQMMSKLHAQFCG